MSYESHASKGGKIDFDLASMFGGEGMPPSTKESIRSAVERGVRDARGETDFKSLGAPSAIEQYGIDTSEPNWHETFVYRYRLAHEGRTLLEVAMGQPASCPLTEEDQELLKSSSSAEKKRVILGWSLIAAIVASAGAFCIYLS